MKSYTTLAQHAYEAYCKAAAHQPLPTWTALGEECQACWLAATRQIVAEMAALH
jgi:hypothetical protein